MKGSASTVVASFDHNKEGEHLSSSIRAGVYQTAAIEIGAVGGSIIIPTLFDISGILPASALAVVGLGVLPFWRQKLRVCKPSSFNGLILPHFCDLLSRFSAFVLVPVFIPSMLSCFPSLLKPSSDNFRQTSTAKLQTFELA